VSVVSGGIKQYALLRPAVFDISQDLRVLFCKVELTVQEQAQFADLVNLILLDSVNTRLDINFGLVAWRPLSKFVWQNEVKYILTEL
jgi:hypothetical protein